MATIWLSLIVCILGCLVYALAANPKATELGRIAFAVGLLITVALAAQHVIKL